MDPQNFNASDSNQSAALASLTATYTDSDASDDESQSHTNNNANAGENKGSRVSRLVSYTLGDEPEIEEGEENDEGSMPYWIPKKDLNPAPTVASTPVDHSGLFTKTNEEDDVMLPPEPPGRCSAQLQEKIARLYDKKMREGKDMNASIQRRKDFRNPSIYEKLISFCLIDELGTNYPPEVYNPHGYAKESFYEELAKVQEEEERKKEKTKVEFVSGTKKTTAAAPLQAASDPSAKDNKKRKSKWDVGASQTAAMPAVIKPLLTYPPGIVPVTTTASGTKATVISAFGTITKKI